MAQFKLLLMTTVMTALIWATADSLVNEAVTVGVLFEPVPSVADTLIASAAAPQQFDVQISGPRRIVEDIQAIAPLSVRFRVQDFPNGPHDVPLDRRNLKDQMAEQWNEFRKLTIVSVVPDVIPIVVDHWVTKNVDLTMNKLTLAYDVEPQLERTSVSVRMRESLLEDRPTGDPLQLDISAEVERVVRDQPAGANVTVLITLPSSPFGTEASLSPGTITVNATVKAQRSTASIPAVPILVAVSFANLEKQLRPVSRDGTPLVLVAPAITVTGPTDEVAKLVRRTTRAYGIIHLKQDDLEDLGTLKLITPDYHLPPRIDLAEPPAPIEFKLTDVTSAVTPGH